MFASSKPEPLVSIVTPSYNMGRYVRETIESVLAQTYPHIEYLVLDAGSTDDTVEILRSYGDRVRWVSERDRGQGDAINKGFGRTTGEIFTFLNADDTLQPEAVSAAVQAFAAHPDAAVVYGEANHIGADGRVLVPYPTAGPEQLQNYCCICQPAAFIRRDAFPGVDTSLHFALDYDLWLRIIRRGRLVRIPQLLANSRMHLDNKTLGKRGAALREAIRVAKRDLGYAGFEQLYAYGCYLVSPGDQFFEPVEPSALKFLLTYALGLRHNPTHAMRWTAECTRELRSYFERRRVWAHL